MKRAIIDLGTNSVLLLIGQSSDSGRIDVLHQRYVVSRLGAHVFEKGDLQPEAMARTLSVLQEFSRDIKNWQVDQVHLIGTEALRRAGNTGFFANLVREQLGWQLQVISGAEEAVYGFTGAVDGLDYENKESAVVDVGGGSTEIIYGRDQAIQDFISLPLGVVELAEKFRMKVQLTEQDRDTIRKKIRTELEQIFFLKKLKTEKVLIGVGGTITTLAAVKENLQRYDPDQIHGYVLDKKSVIEIFESLNRLTLPQRRQIPALVRGREDVILYGTLIYLEVMEFAGFNRVIASDRGLRFGYFKYAEGKRYN
jgi:exopolyphosphatase/guanosine-5'-triphosphate,3'-diphosphate pyrophosphatase